MLVEVMAGRSSEIDYINGWIVKRGKENGISCPMHEAIVELVKEKTERQKRLREERIEEQKRLRAKKGERKLQEGKSVTSLTDWRPRGSSKRSGRGICFGSSHYRLTIPRTYNAWEL